MEARPTQVATPASTAPPPLTEQERRGQAALARVPFAWRHTGYRVVFEPSRSGVLGETNPGTKTVTIWVRETQSADKLLSTIVHELMHAIDFSGNVTQDERNWWMLVRGAEHWHVACYCDDRTRGVGDLAEAAVWVVVPGEAQLALGPLDEMQERVVRQILGL